MLIGILSDTHDNLPQIKKAVSVFNEKKTDLCLHAGDFIAPFVLDVLMLLNCPWQGVFGNNDGEKKGLLKKSEGKICEPPFYGQFEGRRLCLVHDIETVDVDNNDANIIVCGHTHKLLIKELPDKLIINPGECCGWLSGKSTIALLDTYSLKAQIINL
ncbi:MAG: metallophosphoesterase [Candidatus Omnitrophica bacterium]|nr:metallophosphoesterase [Candidatus Omnitrophota bacterium]